MSPRRGTLLVGLSLAVVVSVIIGVGHSALLRQPQPLGASGEWTLVLDEDFDQQTLDEGLWSTGERWESEGRSADEAWLPVPHTSEQVQIEDGVLHLSARRGDNLPDGRSFTSAHVNTRDGFTLPEGSTTFVEGRLDVPSGRGLLPQFWLLGEGDASTDQGWPITGEVDLLEMANANNDEFSRPYFSVWFPSDVYSSPPGTFLSGTHVTHTDSFVRRPELFAGWHTWGLYRSPERMDLFIDGKKAFSFEPGEVHGDQIALPEMLFTNSLHIRLSLGVGGDWAGRDWDLDELQEGDLLVDYVRVWLQD